MMNLNADASTWTQRRSFLVLLLIALITGLNTVACGNSDSGVAPSPSSPTKLETSSSLEGVHLLSNGSVLEIKDAGNGQVTLVGKGQFLQSVNPKNKTFAVHPKIKGTHSLIDGIVYIVRNYDYTDGHDVEENTSGANIRGKRQTIVMIEPTSTGIKLTIKIYSAAKGNNANYLVATRTFK